MINLFVNDDLVLSYVYTLIQKTPNQVNLH